MTNGERLRSRRRRAGVPIHVLSRLANVNDSVLSRAERDLWRLSPDAQKRIDGVLDDISRLRELFGFAVCPHNVVTLRTLLRDLHSGSLLQRLRALARDVAVPRGLQPEVR